MLDHVHHRSSDPQTQKSLGDRAIRVGAICAAITAIFVLIAIIFAAGDKYGFSPAVQARSLPLINAHEKSDSSKWKENDKDHSEIRNLVKQEFKVIMVYTKAGMSERAKQIANDELINDTTIAPELKNQY